mmetsp:Transcript_28494/g.50902  ORF Transcript_28494/g.50902 Transcript_28494/m.50902 type:complete len:99 (-) Transcript_28494:75-371(-)
MDDAGVDFYSYNWIIVAGKAEGVFNAAIRTGEADLVELVESMALLGLTFNVPMRNNIEVRASISRKVDSNRKRIRAPGWINVEHIYLKVLQHLIGELL